MKELLTKAKKIPLFWILFGWNIMLAWGILKTMHYIGKSILGYWKCDDCRQWFWIEDKKCFHPEGLYSGTPDTLCISCKENRLQKSSARIALPPKIRSGVQRPVKSAASITFPTPENGNELINQYIQRS